MIGPYKSLLRYQLCCFCGQSNCNESTDHQKISIQQLQSQIHSHKRNQQQVQILKNTVKNLYKEVKTRIMCLLQQDQINLQIYLNKFFFTNNFIRKNKKQIKFIAEIMQKKISLLPNKNMKKVLRKLQQQSKLKQEDSIQQIRQKIKYISQSFSVSDLLQNLKDQLPSKSITCQQDRISLKPKRSISQVTNPQEIQYTDSKKIYQWKNIKLTQNSKIISLSNKNISDRQVMEQLPIIASFTNLREFQIRNNKISSLSCNLIANNMPFLLSVDIRGNNINDKGIIKLINAIPKMKSFFISQTEATDESANQIATKLLQLQVLWSQHTKISNQVGLKIASKAKLKILSLIGNPIDDEYKEKMRKLFISKGYISI